MRTFSPYTINPVLLDLLRQFDDNTPSDITFDEVHELTQLWVLGRQTPGIPDIQRWQAQPWRGFDGHNADELLQAAAKLGFVDEVADVRRAHFDYVIIPGGTPAPQRRRLALVARLADSGLSFDHLIFMGGRKHDAKLDTWANLTSDFDGALPIDGNWHPPTLNELRRGGETRVNQEVYNQAVLSSRMRRVHPKYVTGAAAGAGKNVGAADQVNAWMTAYQPASGSVLIATVQPHLAFQAATWNQLLVPRGFTVDAVAATARSGRHDVPYVYDGIARGIHVAWKEWKK